jgi:hypothetical protein
MPLLEVGGNSIWLFCPDTSDDVFPDTPDELPIPEGLLEVVAEG